MEHTQSTWWTRLLADVPATHAFHLQKRTVHNLVELQSALQNMSDHEFTNHVDEHKNDFATWVADMFADHELANSIRRAKTPHRAAHEIEKRIKEATAHVEHKRTDMKSSHPQLKTVIANIEQLEKDLNNIIGHNTKNAHYKYDKAPNLTLDVLYRIHWKEMLAGIALGFVFTVLLLRISGVI